MSSGVQEFSVRELTAVFYSQWEAPQEVDKYEERMFADLIEALQDPNRCICIGDDDRLINDCSNCAR